MPRWRHVFTTGIKFLCGQTADQRSRVTIVGLGETHQNLDRVLRQTSRFDIVPAGGDADAMEPDPAHGGPAGARPGILRPPIVYAGSILIGVLLDIAWPLSFVRRALARPVGGALALAAMVLFIAAIRQLWAAGTPVPGNRPRRP
jgi:hypothetical protein